MCSVISQVSMLNISRSREETSHALQAVAKSGSANRFVLMGGNISASVTFGKQRHHASVIEGHGLGVCGGRGLDASQGRQRRQQS